MNENHPTTFHITHYKAGSQWVFAILSHLYHERIVAPLEGAAHVTRHPVQPGKIYPCVYLTRDDFDRVDKPDNHSVFIVIRDLRDTLVSQYFSVKFSHTIMNPDMKSLRKRLLSENVIDGLLILLEERLYVSAEIQDSWVDMNLPQIHYEDLIKDTYHFVEKMVALVAINVDERQIRAAISRHSFAGQTGRQPGQEDLTSHHRKGITGDWRNYFDDRLKNEFKKRYGTLLIRTGYEADDGW
ncbi:MAG: sulfotransferase domain-containing protein [Deltaproteobacteria bacterium]|nr:sulfotransferase domain-containing protein [Deltaproteobacteria bacterium]